MKASLITIVDYLNYGNRLQNYALCKVLEDLGFDEIETLKFEPLPRKKESIFKRARVYFWSLINDQKVRNRVRLLTEFTAANMPVVSVDDESYVQRDGIFVIGSDQVWNPNWGIGSRRDGVQCASKVEAGRKIAYAASFGISLEDLAPFWKDSYGAWLEGFDDSCVLMREIEGSRIVQSLTGRQIPTVADPTMLLSAQQWSEIERKPVGNAFNEPFCLSFFLGKDVNKRAMRRTIKGRNLRIVDPLSIQSSVGIPELLWLLRHADLVCTDSFHGTVFSLLFEREFLLFERRQRQVCDMSSRIDTLRELFDIGDRCIMLGDALPKAMDGERWHLVRERICQYRKVSLDYLERALRSISQDDAS